MSGDYHRRALELLAAGESFVSVMVVATRGHAPQEAGAKAIVTRQGLACGTIGGGKVEARALQHAGALLEGNSQGSVDMVTWNLQKDVGMSCGGEMQLLFEHVCPQAWTVAIFGAGHVAQALIRTLLTLSCRIVCIEGRHEWLERLPKGNSALKVVPCRQDYEDIESVLESVPQEAACVVMTRGHSTDLPVVNALLRTREPPYLGVIGSEVKGNKLRRELIAMGFAHERVERIRCPLGIAIGNRSEPAEIAISIAAELIKERR